jgi:hypothetical protein
VRKAGILGRLRKRAVLYIDFDSGEWHAMILDYYDFEPVRQNLSLDDFLQLRALSMTTGRRRKQSRRGEHSSE